MYSLQHQAWRKSTVWTVGLLVIGLTVAGCGGSSAAAVPTNTAAAAATAVPTATSIPTATTNPNQASVHIAGNYYGQFSFSPATTTIKVGMTVVWTNDSSAPHTSTNDAGSAVTWDSGMISPGSTFSFTFTHTGTFAYHCNVHAYMHGTIVVTS